MTLDELLSPTLRVQRLVTNASLAWLSIAKLSFDMVSPAASATLFEGCENSRLETAKRQASVGLGRAFYAFSGAQVVIETSVSLSLGPPLTRDGNRS